MTKFAINASSAMLLPSSYKVTESISGSVVPLAMFIVFVFVFVFVFVLVDKGYEPKGIAPYIH